VRDLEAVVQLAHTFGLTHRDTFPMPADNQCIVFERSTRS
jgi:hypothetical protein